MKQIISEQVELDYPKLLMQFSRLADAAKLLADKYQTARATAVSLKAKVNQLTSQLADERQRSESRCAQLEANKNELSTLRSEYDRVKSLKLNQDKKISELEAKISELETKVQDMAKLSKSSTELQELYNRMVGLAESLDKTSSKKVDPNKAVDINSTDWAKFVDGSLV